MTIRKLTAYSFIVLLWLFADYAPAAANPGFVVHYDARSTAMGGTRTAHIRNASAILSNPANLDGINKFDLTLTGTPLLLTAEGPFGTEQKDADFGFGPLFLGAFGARVHERVVIGAGAYALTGLAREFSSVKEFDGRGISTSQAFIEAAVPISVRLTDELSVGAAIRFAYAVQELDYVIPATALRLDQKLTGFGKVPGVTVGVSYQPIPELRLGVRYRSKVSVDISGTTTFTFREEEPTEAKTKTTSVVPHMVDVGGAYSLLDDRLLLALEFRVRFFSESNEKQVQSLEAPERKFDTPLVLGWDTAYELRFGAEYRIKPMYPIRIGYAFTRSATDPTYVNPLFPPPGFVHLVTAGFGVEFEEFHLNVGGGYLISGYDVKTPAESGHDPGHYATGGGLVSVSGSYFF